jgi:hypothetical protein
MRSIINGRQRGVGVIAGVFFADEFPNPNPCQQHCKEPSPTKGLVVLLSGTVNPFDAFVEEEYAAFTFPVTQHDELPGPHP